ncbi:Histone deacetylase complex subunit SAP18 [Spatholobus suberectus]|nr:Histone deacetylase complex subunit SAP18 [Spatholobus suberectus]
MSEGGKRQGGRALPPPPRGPPPPPPSRPRLEPVDREKTCPLLLRVFTKIGGHHTMEDFAVRGKEPKDEVQIYTWKDATLRELTDLVTIPLHSKLLLHFLSIFFFSLYVFRLTACFVQVKEVAPAARRRNAKLSFAFVFPDKNGRFKVQEVGKTLSYGNGRLDDGKALAELGFEIGDYLDVAIL